MKKRIIASLIAIMMSISISACMVRNESNNRTDNKQTIAKRICALNLENFEAVMEELEFTVEHNIDFSGTKDAVGARDPDYKYYVQYINFYEENDAKEFYDSYIEHMENSIETGEYEGSIVTSADGYEKCVISLCSTEWQEGSLPNEMYIVSVRDGNCTIRIFVASFSDRIADDDIAEANMIMEKLGY